MKLNLPLFRSGLILSLISCLLFLFAFRPIPPEVNDQRIIEFVSENIPDLKGSVVAIEEGDIFVEVEKGQMPAPVDLLRTVVRGEPPELHTEKVHLARGVLKPAGKNVGRLVLSSSLLPYARVGDRIRRRPVVLYLDLPEEKESLAGELLQLPQVEALKMGEPGGEAEGTEYLLTLESGFLKLERTGGKEVGRLALERSEEKKYRGRLLPEIEEVASYEQQLRDFLILADGSFLLASNNRIALVRRKNNELETLSWQEISGEIIAVSAANSSTAGDSDQQSVSVIVVYRRQGVVRSGYYQYEPATGKFEQTWVEKWLWVQKTSSGFYGVRIGLYNPFGEKMHPLEIDSSGWSWRERELDIVTRTVPTSLNIRDNYYWRINPEGKLEKYLHGEQIYKTEQTFGGRPLTIEARQGPRTVSVHPHWVVYEKNEQNYILIPYNQTEGGGFFRQLQNYNRSQLYLFQEKDRDLERIWESGRMPGYISAIRRDGQGVYFLQVESENNRSRLYRLKNI